MEQVKRNPVLRVYLESQPFSGWGVQIRRMVKSKSFIYIMFCMAVFIVVLMRDFTPSNELRYLSIADEALENHNFFCFTNHGAIYADKPPFYIWLVMALKTILGTHRMWALTLLSLIPSLIVVRIMDRWCGRVMSSEQSMVATMMLLTCGIYFGTALTVRMDMLMCMFVVLAMRSFWRIYSGEGNVGRERWLFSLYMFLALFTKGPLGILIPLCSSMAFMVLQKRSRLIWSVWGWRTWSVLIVGCALWWSMVYAEGGTLYLFNLLFHQTIGRAVNAFHHERPFYFYFVCIWYCIAPWTLHIAYAIFMSLKHHKESSSLQMFFITTALSTLLLLSMISSKLQVYLLPAIPFMVYGAVMYVPRIKSSFARKAFGVVTVRRVVTAILVVVFVGSLAMHRINSQIGYGELCKTVLKVSDETNISNYSTWNVKNGNDMDVYLHKDVNMISQDNNPVNAVRTPTLLIVPFKYLYMFKSYKARVVGKYSIVIMR